MANIVNLPKGAGAVIPPPPQASIHNATPASLAVAGGLLEEDQGAEGAPSSLSGQSEGSTEGRTASPEASQSEST